MFFLHAAFFDISALPSRKKDKKTKNPLVLLLTKREKKGIMRYTLAKCQLKTHDAEAASFIFRKSLKGVTEDEGNRNVS